MVTAATSSGLPNRVVLPNIRKARCINHQLGVGATAALELPREFATKIGILLREEVARLTKSGFWPARFVPSPVWDPNIPEPQ